MSEREAVLTAVVAWVAAMAALNVSLWIVGAVVVLALATRRTLLVMFAVALLVSVLGARAEAGLATTVQGRVHAMATLVADPEPRPGGLSLEVSLGGHRYRSFVGSSRARPLRSLLTGERFEATGSIGVLRGHREWIASHHLSGRLRVVSVGRTDGGEIWWRAADRLRRTVDAGLSSFDNEERSLFSGVVFGDDRGQPVLTRHRFRASGLAHLLAVSGQNVAFVLVAAAPLLTRLRLRQRWVVTLVVLVGFAMVTRFEPSVLRATAMAAVASTAAMWGRYATGVRVVAIAVLALLVIDPLLVWSGGFRLSVAASAALVVLARPIERRLPGPRWLIEPLAVSLAAQIGTAPLLVAMFGTVPLLSPLANLAAVPVAGWLMVWGVVTGPIAGVIGEPVASWLGWPSRLMIHWIDKVAAVAATPSWPSVGTLGVIAMALGLLVIFLRRSAWRTLCASLGMLALVADLVILVPTGHLRPTSGLDAYISRDVGGRDVVVLTLGAGADDESVLDALTRLRIDHVDMMVVPRPSAHAATIVHLVRSTFGVDEVLAADVSQIRDAVALRSGELRVGTLRFAIVRNAKGFDVTAHM